ncbi:flagellar hook-length control protein FliK [Undibacterium sp. Xuan67W]|uniref:flagellar hook-length control protein FliK n=1 Tax=Undibacterium sp. Xuan67W TaxID=3413057 RepID=UPI003BF3AD00
MQTALIPSSTDTISTSASNSAKQNNAASNASSGASFNQFLNKEITQQKPKEVANAPTPPQKNAAPAASNANKPANSQTPASNTAQATKSDAASNNDNKVDKNKTSSNNDGDQTANDDSNVDKADNAEQTNNAQLIALVGNIGQFSTDTAKVDTSVKDEAKTNDTALAIVDTSSAVTAQLRTDTKDLPDTNLTATGKIGAAPLIKTGENNQAELKQHILPRDKTSLTLEEDQLAQSKTKDNAEALAEPALSANEKNSPKTVAQLAADSVKNSMTGKNASLEKLQDAAPAIPQVSHNFAQQFAISTNQVASTAAAEHLSPRVGSSAWDQAVGQKVVWMVAGGEQTAELTLNPPDLGPLQIVLSVSNDQASATFSSAQPEVREALEAALPRLKQMMSDAGVQLSGFSVNSQASQQNNQQPESQSRSGLSASRQTNGNNEIETSATTTIVKRSTAKIGGVDTFA